jgi:hypothetical protein
VVDLQLRIDDDDFGGNSSFFEVGDVTFGKSVGFCDVGLSVDAGAHTSGGYGVAAVDVGGYLSGGEAYFVAFSVVDA